MIKKFITFLTGGNVNKTTPSLTHVKPVPTQIKSVPSIKNNNTNSSIKVVIDRISWIPSETKTLLIGELQTKTDNEYTLNDIRDAFESHLKVDKATAYKLARTIMAMVETQRAYKDYIKSSCAGIQILGGDSNCKYCESLNGRAWPIRSPNIILPPFHIGCSCSISPIVHKFKISESGVNDNVSDPGPVNADVYDHYMKFQHQFFNVSPECYRDKQIKEMLTILNSSKEQFNFDKEVQKGLDTTVKKLERTMNTQRHNDVIISECLTYIKNVIEQKGDDPTVLKLSAMINEQLIY